MAKRKDTKTATAVAEPEADGPEARISAMIETLAITEDSAGMPLDDLVAVAIQQEDPGSFLELYADPEDDPRPAAASPTGDSLQEPSPAVACRSDSPETACPPAPSPDMANNRGDTWLEEESGPPVLAAPSREETFVVHGPLPWRDASTMERLPGYGFRLIETPVIEPPEGLNQPRHVDVNNLTAAQATAWRQLFLGLEKSGTRLASGRRVTTSADAIRWLLEQLR